MGLYDAFSEDRSITLNDFENAVKNTVPLSVTQAEQIISIRNWANVRAVAATAQEDRMEYTQTSTDSNNPKPEIPTPDDEILLLKILWWKDREIELLYLYKDV